MRVIPPGLCAGLTVTVTDAMTIGAEGLVPVYATYWMVKHMEEAGHHLLVPYLDGGEVGLGSSVRIRHLGPAVAGMEVQVTATHDETCDNRVRMTCEAVASNGELIGEGEIEQVVLSSQRLKRRLNALLREVGATSRG